MSTEQISEMRQYLTFKLGNEIFGIDVAKVREIIDNCQSDLPKATMTSGAI